MSEITVQRVVDEYLAHVTRCLAAGLCTRGNLKKVQFYLGRFAGDFGPQLVRDCRKGDVRRWLLQHLEFKSPHTKHTAAGAVVSCFRWAAEDGLIDVCPYSKPRELPTPQPREPITREEVVAILAVAAKSGYRSTSRAFRVGLWFLWQTGCRPHEMYTLEWRHYDPVRGLFELPSKSTAKTGRKRLIVLNRRAWRLIRLMARAGAVRVSASGVVPVTAKVVNPLTGPVFRNGRGRPWNRRTFGCLFRLNARRAGVREGISTYCLRHGFCCELLEAGNGERQIADVMGHASTRYVSWYGKGVRERAEYLRDVAERRKG